MIAARRAPSRAPISEAALRREVSADLVDLLNTTNLDAALDLEDAPEVRALRAQLRLSRSLDAHDRRATPRSRSPARSRRRSAISSRGSPPARSRSAATHTSTPRRCSSSSSSRPTCAPSRSTCRWSSSPRWSSTPARSRSIGCSAMNREFLDFYNRELGVLREQASGVRAGISRRRRAPRRPDRRPRRPDDLRPARRRGVPGRARATEDQARVRRFHDQPDRSARRRNIWRRRRRSCWREIAPKFGDPALREGRAIPRGAYFEATYREMERNVACRFRLTAPITLWPFDLVKAEYFTSPAPLQALLPAERRRRRRRACGCNSPCAPPPGARTSRSEEEARQAREFWASRCRDEIAAVPSARPRGGRGRALRADVRALPRRLFPPPRFLRRSRRRSARRRRHAAPDRLRRGRRR